MSSRAHAAAEAVLLTAPDTRMPALYLGHGAPPLLDDALWMGELAAWAEALPRPTGIVILSAHWESAPLAISATAAGTPLVYDFSGFAPRFSRMTYDTPDAAALAALLTSVLPDAQTVHQHTSRGLDHHRRETQDHPYARLRHRPRGIRARSPGRALSEARPHCRAVPVSPGRARVDPLRRDRRSARQGQAQ